MLGHHSPTRASFHPKTRWQLFPFDTKSSWILKSRFGEGWFFTFLAPLLLIFIRELGQNGDLTNYWVVLPIFVALIFSIRI
jgi:hypothetical protein